MFLFIVIMHPLNLGVFLFMSISEISALDSTQSYLDDLSLDLTTPRQKTFEVPVDLWSLRENKGMLSQREVSVGLTPSTATIREIFAKHVSKSPPEVSNSSFDAFIQQLHPEMKECHSLAKKITSLFKERIGFIRNQIEKYRLGAEVTKMNEPFFTGDGVFYVDPNCLERIPDGISGSYFLLDAEGNKRYVVKPIDEDCGCLNNPKGYMSLMMKSPIRDDMPLYLSSLKEALTYEAVKSIGIQSVAPKTILVILESPGFSYFDLTDTQTGQNSDSFSTQTQSYRALMFKQIAQGVNGLQEGVLRFCIRKAGPPPREKLCSAQEFVSDSQPLFEVGQRLQDEYGSDLVGMANRFDQKQFEETNILIWTTYDTDAHAGNILVHPLRLDEQGREVYGFKKIDNGLAFPNTNRQLRNALNYLPNMKRTLSDEGRAKIYAVDVDIISEKMKYYGMDNAIPSFLERISLLKELAMKEGITLEQINKEMTKLENGYEDSSRYNFDSNDSMSETFSY